ncbi:hypothetical protein BC834DRAFT_879357 [Gloeopeniophorella convolvens]|nr:hypothetical protein BC834DRAFT_879357 [Gloeopeniophorella convolvens]
MSSSYNNDIYSQPNQFRPATFSQIQPGPARVYSNPTPSSSNPSPVRQAPPPAQPRASSRPYSIAELAERAKQSLGEETRPFKSWLRVAENARKDGKTFQEQGDLESAFVEFARAATIVLEKIPAHPDYRVLLSSTQRHNMGLHGQEILDSLAEIKISIMTRYEQWRSNSSSESQPSPAQPANPPPQPLSSQRSIRSPGTSTPSSISTPSSSRSRVSMAPRSRTPSPYRQGSRDDERAWREREEAMQREEARRREEASAADRARSEQAHLSREDEARRRRDYEEDGRRRLALDQRRQEQDGILRRQKEAEYAAQAARYGQTAGQTQVIMMPQPTPASLSAPSVNQYASVPASGPAPSAPVTPGLAAGPGYLLPTGMPLESPTRPHAEKPARTPFQPPITTTSPPPAHLGAVQYPSLMSQHQIAQGYHPSLSSMFHRPSHASHGGLLFQTPEPAHHHHHFYQHLLPKKSEPVHPPYRNGSTPRPPPLPPKELVAPAPGGADPVARELKTVSFPRDCLHRFTSIAAINTARNRETCGLLLGKDQDGRFIVTTLLIPRQHSTSDTCAMDEEELVMQFTEERSLITLGWIHTHPTQSCFMSSVDLHTHSGFQCMLPESFAVVCAPKSTPNFGIFRLTDPPGLQTILECDAKEAFHPHPERPIYTDADKGHVQIRDLPLEIVDLR